MFWTVASAATCSVASWTRESESPAAAAAGMYYQTAAILLGALAWSTPQPVTRTHLVLLLAGSATGHLYHSAMLAGLPETHHMIIRSSSVAFYPVLAQWRGRPSSRRRMLGTAVAWAVFAWFVLDPSVRLAPLGAYCTCLAGLVASLGMAEAQHVLATERPLTVLESMVLPRAWVLTQAPPPYALVQWGSTAAGIACAGTVYHLFRASGVTRALLQMQLRKMAVVVALHGPTGAVLAAALGVYALVA